MRPISKLREQPSWQTSFRNTIYTEAENRDAVEEVKSYEMTEMETRVYKDFKHREMYVKD
jgi:hypothetical protein